jgi:hypothetical protein
LAAVTPGTAVAGQRVALVTVEEAAMVTVTPAEGASRLQLSSTARLLTVIEPVVAGTQL